MAGTVMHVGHWIMAVGFWIAAVPAMALGIADPTRPPNVNVEQLANASSQASYGPQLSAIVTMRDMRRRALISSEWVEVGSVIGAFRVVSITPDRVILKGASGAETLRLTPQVELIRKEKMVHWGDENKRQGRGKSEAKRVAN